MAKFWRSVAIGAVLLMILVVGYTLVLAQDSDDAEPPVATEPADDGTGPESTFGFGRRGAMPHGRGGMDGDWMMPDNPGDWSGRGGMMGARGLTLDIVAEVLELTAKEVKDELADGISIAELATAHDIDVQAIIDASLAQSEEVMAAAVENGRMSQEQAAEMLAHIADRIADQVNTPWTGTFGPSIRPDGFDLMPRGGRGSAMPQISWLDTVANELGLTPEELQTGLAEGVSIADLAAEHDVDIQLIIDALVVEHMAVLDTAVEEGRLTQEKADAMQTNAEEHFAEMVENAGLGSMHHRGGAPGALPEEGMPLGRFGADMMGVSWLDTIAAELGLTVDELHTEMAEGSTVADLAAEHDVDLQIIVDVLLAEHEAAVSAAVEGGRLTQEQADAMQANMAERITDMVENGWDAGPCGPGRMPGGRGGRGMGPNDGAFPSIPQRRDTNTSSHA